MFDIGWSEMGVIAVVALLFLGPKELPNALRTATQWMRQARRLAREFQGGIDEIVREAELEEARKTLQSVNRGSIAREIEKAVDPTGEVTRSLNAPDLAKAEDPAKPPATPLPAPPTESAGFAVAAPPAAVASSEPAAAEDAKVAEKV